MQQIDRKISNKSQFPQKAIKIALALSLGGILTISTLELLLRLFPVKTVHQFAENDAREPVLRSKSSSIIEPIDWKFSHAHQRKINNYGFVDDRDFTPKSQPIAIIGDSYIQSTMLPYKDTIQARLTAKFGARIPVYSFGIPQYSLAGYLGAAEYATREFQPRAFVFVLNEGDITDSLKAQKGSYFLNRPNGELQFQKPQLNPVNELIKQSALYRYLFAQIKFDPARIVKQQFKVASEPKGNMTVDDYQQISTRLLNLFAEQTSINRDNTIFVIDSDRTAMTKKNTSKKSNVDRAELLTFKQVAQSQGYTVVDTQDSFTNYYLQTGQTLDFMPSDFHWNAAAHKLVAENVYPKLKKILNE